MSCQIAGKITSLITTMNLKKFCQVQISFASQEVILEVNTEQMKFIFMSNQNALYLGNPTDVKRKKSYSSLCMLAYTDIEKEMDFPA